MIAEYRCYKEEYFSKYNPDVFDSLKYVERQEPWVLNQQLKEIDELFNLLPEFCTYPIKYPYMVVINQLIPILAYMPLTDMLGALYYLGVKSSDWGYAIHKIAYEYTITLKSSIRDNKKDSEDELLIAAHQVNSRITLLSRIAVINIIGEK